MRYLGRVTPLSGRAALIRTMSWEATVLPLPLGPPHDVLQIKKHILHHVAASWITQAHPHKLGYAEFSACMAQEPLTALFWGAGLIFRGEKNQSGVGEIT